MTNEQKLREALQKLRSYNVSIAAGQINYRPEDHIAVIDRALSQPTSDEGTPTETPLTDAAVQYVKEFSASLNRYVGTSLECVSADFARQLEHTLHAKERELADAIHDIERMMTTNSELATELATLQSVSEQVTSALHEDVDLLNLCTERLKQHELNRDGHSGMQQPLEVKLAAALRARLTAAPQEGKAALDEMTRLAQENGEYDLPPPPATPRMDDPGDTEQVNKP